MNTIIESFNRDGPQMQWVFNHMLEWETANFPPGAARVTPAQLKSYKHTRAAGEFHVHISWTQHVPGYHPTIRGMSGLLTWWPDTFEGVGYGYVSCFFVNAFARGQGVGRLLFEDALALITMQGLRPMALVIEDNEPMLALMRDFKNQGYFREEALAGRRCNYHGDGRKLRYVEFS